MAIETPGQGIWSSASHGAGHRTLLIGVALALAALSLAALPYYLREVALLAGWSELGPPHYWLTTCGNTVLAAATAIYLSNLWFNSEETGRWGSRLAALGAAVLLLDLAQRGLAPDTGQFGLTNLFSVILVVLYLLMEAVAKSRVLGAFVMPVVIFSVPAEMWLLNHGSAGAGALAFTGLKTYWGHAFVVAQAIGYGAFLAAAVLGLLWLARQPASGARAPQDFPGRVYSGMVSMLMLAFPLSALALLFAAGWALDGGELSGARLSRHAWVVGVTLINGALVYALFRGRNPGPRLAWLSVGGFGAALAGFLVVHSLLMSPAGA